MDVRKEIAKQVERLPQDLQEQVLQFVASLTASSLSTPSPTGERGATALAARQLASHPLRHAIFATLSAT